MWPNNVNTSRMLMPTVYPTCKCLKKIAFQWNSFFPCTHTAISFVNCIDFNGKWEMYILTNGNIINDLQVKWILHFKLSSECIKIHIKVIVEPLEWSTGSPFFCLFWKFNCLYNFLMIWTPLFIVCLKHCPTDLRIFLLPRDTKPGLLSLAVHVSLKFFISSWSMIDACFICILLPLCWGQRMCW